MPPELRTREEQEEQEAPRPVLQGADPGAGEALPPAALPVRPGAGAAGPDPQPHPDPSQDLVPESPLQDEKGPGGGRAAGPGRPAAPAAAAPGHGSDPGPGREAVSHLFTGAGESRLLFLPSAALPCHLPSPRRSAPPLPAALPGLRTRLEGLLERPGPVPIFQVSASTKHTHLERHQMFSKCF